MILSKEWRYYVRSCFLAVSHRQCLQFSSQPNLSRRLKQVDRSLLSDLDNLLYLKFCLIVYLYKNFKIINSSFTSVQN